MAKNKVEITGLNTSSIKVLTSEYYAKNFTQIIDYSTNNISNHADCIVTNNDNLIYNVEYVLEQLNKAVKARYR